MGRSIQERRRDTSPVRTISAHVDSLEQASQPSASRTWLLAATHDRYPNSRNWGGGGKKKKKKKTPCSAKTSGFPLICRAFSCYDAAPSAMGEMDEQMLPDRSVPEACHRSWPGSAPTSSAGSTLSRRARAEGSVECLRHGTAMTTPTRSRQIATSAWPAAAALLAPWPAPSSADQDRLGQVVPGISLVTSSRARVGSPPPSSERGQLGLGGSRRAWTWLHKLRKAMVRARIVGPLAGRVRGRRDAPSAARGRAGAAGRRRRQDPGRAAVEAGRGKARGRRLGRLRLAPLADASAESLDAFLAAQRRQSRRPWPPTAGVAPAACRPRATTTSRGRDSAPPGASAALRWRSTWCSASSSAGCWAPTTARWAEAPPRLSRRVRVPLQSPHRSPRLRPLVEHRAHRALPATEISSLHGTSPDGHG